MSFNTTNFGYYSSENTLETVLHKDWMSVTTVVLALDHTVDPVAPCIVDLVARVIRPCPFPQE